jgi:type III secretion system YscQ/HrcQ family protein
VTDAPAVLATLPRLDERAVAALRDAPHPWNPTALAAARQAAESLLGAALELRALGPPRLCTLAELRTTAPAHAVGLALSTGTRGDAGPWWLELDPAGAALWVDRVLGGDGLEAPVPLALPLDATSQGVLAYLVARVLAAHGEGLGLETLGQPPAPEQLQALGICHAATLVCAGAACSLRLWTALSIGASGTRAAAWTDQGPAAALELMLVADAGTLALGSAELGALARGDVVLLDELEPWRAASGWRGPIRVHVAEGGTGAILCCVRDGDLVVEGFEPSEEPRMTHARSVPSAEQPPALVALADVPVQLSLELGRFAVTLQELSALRAGDVLVSGLPVGQRVALRAGTQLVARGELVEVDGELGLRIETLATP